MHFADEQKEASRTREERAEIKSESRSLLWVHAAKTWHSADRLGSSLGLLFWHVWKRGWSRQLIPGSHIRKYFNTQKRVKIVCDSATGAQNQRDLPRSCLWAISKLQWPGWTPPSAHDPFIVSIGEENYLRWTLETFRILSFTFQIRII